MLPSCKGASNSYVSHDECYTSMIDYIGLPVERVDSVMHIEIVDDDSLNVSRHRQIICFLQFRYTQVEDVDNVNVHTQSVVPRINWKQLNDEHIQY